MAHGASFQGSAPISSPTPRYRHEGRSGREPISPRLTSWGIANVSGLASARGSAQATTVWVVPRSMPTTSSEGMAERFPDARGTASVIVRDHHARGDSTGGGRGTDRPHAGGRAGAAWGSVPSDRQGAGSDPSVEGHWCACPHAGNLERPRDRGRADRSWREAPWHAGLCRRTPP